MEIMNKLLIICLGAVAAIAITYFKTRSVFNNKLAESEKLLAQRDVQLQQMKENCDQQRQKAADLQYQLNEAKKDIAAAKR